MWSEVLSWILIGLYAVLLVSTATVIVLENRQPAKTIAWMIVIWLLPVVGLVVFYFFGQNLRRQYDFRRHGYITAGDRLGSTGATGEAPAVPERFSPLAHALSLKYRSAVSAGNAVELLPSGRSFLQSLLQDLRAASDHVHIETYIIEDDPVGRLLSDALADCVRRGVEVRLLYDDVGCWNVPDSFFRQMEAAGITVCAFRSVRFPAFSHKVNYRNHRKLCVIDGRTGYIGGMNFAQRYFPQQQELWRDTQMRIAGTGVGALQRVFLSDWVKEARLSRTESRYFPVAAAPQPGTVTLQLAVNTPYAQYPEIMYSLTWLIQNARKYLYIQTPYFMPTTPVLQALQTAALTGVDVRLMLPQKPDALMLRWANESFFKDVLASGVKVFLYTAGFLHAKTVVMDDDVCTVGSSNIDFRSFENNFEANAIVYGKETAVQVRKLFESDLEKCQEIGLAQWEMRPLWRKLLESHTRILSPLF